MPKFNMKEIERLMSEGIESIELSTNKEITILLGPTGAGKSTLINYMIGLEMSLVVDERDWSEKVEVKGTAAAKIGHGTDSETLYPAVYEDKVSTSVYGDFPGFSDNRGIDEKVVTSFTTQMAVEKAKAVRGIVMVVDYEALDAQKGHSFKELTCCLSHLFKQPDEIKNSICFVFNKFRFPDKAPQSVRTEKKSVEIILNKIKEQLKSVEGKIKKLSSGTYVDDKSGANLDKEGENKQELMKEKQVIEMILDEEGKRIVPVMSSDFLEPRLRTVLKGRVEQFGRSIQSTTFDFGTSDPTRRDFVRELECITQNGISETQKVVGFTKDIKRKNENLEILNDDLKKNEVLLRNSCKYEEIKVKVIEQEQLSLKNKINSTKKLIDDLDSKFSKFSERQEATFLMCISDIFISALESERKSAEGRHDELSDKKVKIRVEGELLLLKIRKKMNNQQEEKNVLVEISLIQEDNCMA